MHLTKRQSRRNFLRQLSRLGVVGGLGGLGTWGCSHLKKTPAPAPAGSPVAGPFLTDSLPPSFEDRVVVAPGLQAGVLIRWQDSMGAGLNFGFNNDFTSYLPLSRENPSDGILMVNHEYPDPVFINKTPRNAPKTKSDTERERESVGLSLLRIRQNSQTRAWEVVKGDARNRRFTGNTPIGFSNGATINGARKARGTLANCAGGQTPWGTFLSCEENYQDFWGEYDYASPDRSKRVTGRMDLGWHRFESGDPEHYGWVVEVKPDSGQAQKLISLGRFAHEGATVGLSQTGRAVVYMGDDEAGQCLYKFISDSSNSLDTGVLYVANLEKGQWIPLSRDHHPALKARFRTNLEMLIRTREAARLVGGSPLDRPEDIEILPGRGEVLVALTGNKLNNNLFGSLLRVREMGGDLGALQFSHSGFLSGGVDSGVACPDNLAVDPLGNLWVTSDMSGHDLGKGPYRAFGNNSLFYIPTSGDHAGRPFRLASAPNGAELTGPSFSADGRTLFLSVQHPGEHSPSHLNPTSHWPDGGTEMPRPSVIYLTGPLLDRLMSRA